MISADKEKAPYQLRESRRVLIDIAAMLIYVFGVYGWSLWLWPLGRDYAALASQGAGMPLGARQIFAWEIESFGNWAVAYHLVNIILVYLAMVLIYKFVKVVLRGPHWLGTLAATLFMANPVHSEAVLNLSGVGDLFPFVLALTALTAYVTGVVSGKIVWTLVALAAFAMAVVSSAVYAFLVAVLLLYELLMLSKEKRSLKRIAPFLVLSVASWFVHADSLFNSVNVTRMFSPVYFIFYPLGFLPETALAYVQTPWLGWISALTVIALAVLIYRATSHRAMLFGLLGMVALRLLQDETFIDPVHLSGGGELLLPNVLFNLAVVTLFYRMMSHPKWRHPVVILTTFLCAVFFSLQIQTIWKWEHAGQVVREFQQGVAAAEGPVGVLPDYLHYRGAPVALSESIRFDTPFSVQHDYKSLLWLNYSKALQVKEQAPNVFRFQGTAPLELVPYPFTLADKGNRVETEAAVVEVLDASDELVLRVIPKDGAPMTPILPGAIQPTPVPN